MDNFVADAIWIDTPPAELYAALLQPEVALEWLDCDEARIAPTLGGEFTILRGEESSSGHFATLTPGAEIRIEDWRTTGAPSDRGSTRLTFTLEARDTGTWFTVREDELDGVENWQTLALEARKTWVAATVALKREVEGI